MRHYLFIENVTCEEFLIYASNYDVAWNIAKAIWDDGFETDLEYCYEMTDYEAEMSGLDEY